MKHIEIKLHILYILVAVIVTCEARFSHPGHKSVDEEDYDDEETESVPVTFVYNRMKVPDNEGPPMNVIFNGAPYNGWNPDGRYTHPHPVTGRLLSYKGLQASKGEISPYASYLSPSGQYRGMYPARVYEKVNSDRPSFYNRPLLSRDDIGYPNLPRISNKVDFDSRSRAYDAFQAARPDQNKVYADNRSRLQKFRRPSAGQAKMAHPEPYGESFEWNYNKYPASEEPYTNRYLLIRSIRDNSTVRERGDPALQDNFAPYDSYVDPDDYYVVDVKKRFKADYNLSL